MKVSDNFIYDGITGKLFRKTNRKEVYIERTKKGPKVTHVGRRMNARLVVAEIIYGFWPEKSQVKCVDGDKNNLRQDNFYLPPPGHQFCKQCRTGKPITEFSVDNQKRTKYSSWCRSCQKAKAVDRRKYYKHGHTLKKYGLSETDYEQMLIKQNGVCAICSKPQKPSTKRLAVDHCHTTGIVRGLLCSGCNTAIGQFNDNIETLKSAISYLTPLTITIT